MTVIKGARLTTFEVAADGSTVSINVADENATPVSLVLPSECLTAMIMSLPEMMRQSLQRRHRDPSLRLVYPVGDWELEASTDPGRLILTLRTPDGFHVSFAVAADELKRIAALGAAPPPRDAPTRPH
jgi:hypothetical protein